jgi:hypothetical protein
LAKSAKLEMLFIISQAAKNFKNNSTVYFLRQNHSKTSKFAKWGELLKHQRNFLTDFWVNLSKMSTLLDSLQLSSDWICGNPWLGRFYHRSKLSLASNPKCGQLSTMMPTLN